MTILHIDSSARIEGSVTRDLTRQIVAQLGGDVIRRDLKDALPLIDEAWVTANFTPAEDRSAAQRETLALSDTLVEELQQADTIVIGVPLYNFSVPAALKAWIDLVARAGMTFKYTENGPVGLLEGKRAIVATATGGVPVNAPVDFATPYLRQFLRFIGISDVEFVAAERVVAQGEAAIDAAKAEISKLAA